MRISYGCKLFLFTLETWRFLLPHDYEGSLLFKRVIKKVCRIAPNGVQHDCKHIDTGYLVF